MHALQFCDRYDDGSQTQNAKCWNLLSELDDTSKFSTVRRNINWSNLTNVQSANPESVMKDQRPVGYSLTFGGLNHDDDVT